MCASRIFASSTKKARVDRVNAIRRYFGKRLAYLAGCSSTSKAKNISDSCGYSHLRDDQAERVCPTKGDTNRRCFDIHMKANFFSPARLILDIGLSRDRLR